LGVTVVMALKFFNQSITRTTLETLQNAPITLEDIRERLIKYQRSYRWKVYIQGAENVITMRASKCTLPLTMYETDAWIYEGTREYYPAVQDVSEVTIVLREDEHGTVGEYLRKWATSIRRPDGCYEYPGTYKKQIVLHYLDSNGTLTTQYKATGAFPKSLGSLEPDYDENNILIYNVSFSVDSVWKIV